MEDGSLKSVREWRVLLGLLAAMVIVTGLYLLLKWSTAESPDLPILPDGKLNFNHMVDLLYWTLTGVLLADLQLVARTYRQSMFTVSTRTLLVRALIGLGIGLGVGMLAILTSVLLAEWVDALSITFRKTLSAFVVPVAFMLGFYKDVWLSGSIIFKEEHRRNTMETIKAIPGKLFAIADRT